MHILNQIVNNCMILHKIKKKKSPYIMDRMIGCDVMTEHEINKSNWGG